MRCSGGEGLAARSAEFASDRVNKTDLIGFPQHAFDLAVTIARCESRGRVAKCIASIRVGSIGKQLLHNIDVTAIRGSSFKFCSKDALLSFELHRRLHGFLMANEAYSFGRPDSEGKTLLYGRLRMSRYH
jgi:hypothetical protein